MGYKDWLLKSGLTEEQIEDKMAELDEVKVIEIDCWEELSGKVINGFRFGFIKQLMSVSSVENGKERNHAIFNVELNPNLNPFITITNTSIQIIIHLNFIRS